MKKQIFTLVGAISFSLTTLAQDYTGIWASDEDTSYYVVILYNSDKGYIFTNFSFIEQNIIQENFMYENENYIKTVVHNPENGWRVYIEYEYLNKDTLRLTYSGDFEGSQIANRKNIL
tara:strand:+ start:1469 stop:1822 length:354 start_codon:yes stop_codon:yes gene_type:complete